MIKKNDLIKQIASYLRTSDQMVAVAESCTGGLLSADLTKLPGSSVWFDRGFVTYSNAAKTTLLGVSEKILTQYGAVSHETAKAMAEGALKSSQAQIALSITGIAGPEGGTLEKPVGTVWFAIAAQNKSTVTHLEKIDGTRNAIRQKAVVIGLNLILQTLKGDPKK